MHPFSSSTSQRVVHENMVQEAMEQSHIDAQLSIGRSLYGALRHFLRGLAGSVRMKERQQASVIGITPLRE